MKRLAAALALLGLLFAAKPLLAQDEATIKGAFIMCAQQSLMIACDDLIAMPNLSDTVRSNAYGVRSSVLARLGRLEEAKHDIAKALELDPGNAPAAKFRAVLLGLKQSPEMTVFDRCQHDPDTKSRIEACSAFVKQYASDPARQAAAFDLRAAAFNAEGAYDKAIADLAAADKLAPDREGALDHMVVTITQSGDYARALRVLEDGAKRGKISTDMMMSRAGLRYFMGDRTGAVVAFDAASTQQPNLVMAKFWSAIIRLELHQDAERDLRRLLDDPMMSPLGAAIIKYRLGEGSRQAILAETTKIPGKEGQTGLCMALFNLGHDAWIHGKASDADQTLGEAVQTCDPTAAEYQAAKLLLARPALQ